MCRTPSKTNDSKNMNNNNNNEFSISVSVCWCGHEGTHTLSPPMNSGATANFFVDLYGFTK